MIRCPHPLAAALAALALLLSAAGASAQQDTTSPWYIGASLDVTRESNVLQTPDGSTAPRSSDTVYSTALQAGLNHRFGRQRVYLDGTLRDNRYAGNSELDNNGYGLTAGLDWATLGRLAGDIVVSAYRTPSRFNTGDAPTLDRTNTEKALDAKATVRLGIVTRLALFTELGYRRVDHTAPEFDYRAFRQDSAAFGVSYRFSGALSTNVSYRVTRGEYPRFFTDPGTGTTSADEIDGRYIDVGATWVATGASTVSTRLSLGRTEYSRLSQRDFSGLTGVASWNWQPSARMSVTTTLSRDSGQETAFLPLGLPDPTSPDESGLTTDTSRLTNAVDLSVGYQLTGKTSASLGWRHSRRGLVDTLSASGGGSADRSGSDRTSSYALGLSWLPTRTVTVACTVGREQRDGDGTLSTTYGSNRYGCSVRLRLD